MILLTGAVVVVGALCLLDLVLTVGVLRRLREQSRFLAPMMSPPVSAPIGTVVPDSAVTTVDGDAFTLIELPSDALVAFLSPACPPCREQLPAFVEHAARVFNGVEHALAVVVADGPGTDEMVDALRPVARVVVEQPHGPIATALRVSATPAFVRLDDGVVAHSAHSMTQLLAPA